MRIKAFSLVEMITILVIIGILSALAFGFSRKGADGAQSVGSNVTLSTLRSDFNQYAYAHSNEYPANLQNSVTTPGVTYVTNTARVPGEVSLWRESPTSMVIAQIDKNGQCSYVFNSLNERAKWGIAKNSAEYCNAETIGTSESVKASTVSTDPLKPSSTSIQ